MDQNEQNQKLLTQLTEMLRQAQPASPAPMITAPGATPWQQPPSFGPAPQQFGAPVQPCGLLVALDIETPGGRVGAYLQLPASALANPQAAIAALQQAGFPLRFYRGGNETGNSWGGRRSFGRRW